MKRIYAILLAALLLCAALCPAGLADTELYGYAIDKLATRDGPGTTYTEKGTYDVRYTYVRVLTRAWDERNGIWWVKCVIPYHGENRVLWTGYKRFDPNTLPLESIPVEGEEKTGGRNTGSQGWQAEYRQLISSGQYDLYLSNPNGEYNSMLQTRERKWDSFILHDIDGNGIPELIVLTMYAMEQADVFTWTEYGVSWAGRMGGENFFQFLFHYPVYPQAGLLTAEGGPAMKIRSYTLDGTILREQVTGMTEVDWEGMETTGISMYVSNDTLYRLLYDTMTGTGTDRSVYLEDWCSLEDLVNNAAWDRLFR
jgi:hypothetical protein